MGVGAPHGPVSPELDEISDLEPVTGAQVQHPGLPSRLLERDPVVVDRENATGDGARWAHLLTRPWYSPVRVSTLITSPSLMKRGTWTVAPAATVAGLVALVAVLPFTAGSQ